MSNSQVDLLQSANHRMKEFRQKFAPSAEPARSPLVSPEDLQALRRVMEQVRPVLEENPDDPAVRAEIAAYAEHLRELKSLLESLQSELTARREDLRAEWKRLQAAAQWGDSLKRMP